MVYRWILLWILAILLQRGCGIDLDNEIEWDINKNIKKTFLYNVVIKIPGHQLLKYLTHKNSTIVEHGLAN